MSESNVTALQTGHSQSQQIVGVSAIFTNPELMGRVERFAELMASGKSTVPQHLSGNVGDCMAVTLQAMQWGMNPFAVAQKTHTVNGTLGYEAQLVNAVITSMAPTTGRLHFEWFGSWEKIVGKFEIKRGEKGEYRIPGWNMADEEGLGVKVWATLKGESQPRELTLLLAQARTRNSTLWADDPKQQIAYLAIKKWSRLYTPDVIMGVYTPDELEQYEVKDMGSADVVREAEQTILPVYSDDDFDANFPKWAGMIQAGKKTPDQLIAFLNSKATLSDKQQDMIRNVEVNDANS